MNDEGRISLVSHKTTCSPIAWNGYLNRKINVKKYGLPGISLLLLGLCTLGYAWRYDHISKCFFPCIYDFIREMDYVGVGGFGLGMGMSVAGFDS